MRSTTIKILIPGLFLLAACATDDQTDDTGGDTGDAPGALPDPCTLLTESEVAAALGAPEARQQSTSVAGGGAGCDWTGPEVATANGDLPASVSLDVYPGAEYYAPESYAEDVEQVSGLGDAAAVSEGTSTVLWVQDEVTFQLQIVTLSPTPRSELEELARQASGRFDS